MISIVIRTYEDGQNLKRCIRLLKKQSMRGEIIVVDSYSKDITMKVCEEYNCMLVQCDEPFSFGKALNQGIKKTSFDIVCIISSHCFPKDDGFLGYMYRHFEKRNVAGVYARQVPHPMTNPVEYRNFLHIYGNEQIIQSVSPQFNNGASMIRKKAWERCRFDEDVIAQEDVLWAKKILEMGFLIVYEPQSVVEHLHNESILATVSRYEKETRALMDMGYVKW